MVTSREDRSAGRAAAMPRVSRSQGGKKPSMKVPGTGGVTRPEGRHEGSRDERSAIHDADAMSTRFGGGERHDYDA